MRLGEVGLERDGAPEAGQGWLGLFCCEQSGAEIVVRAGKTWLQRQRSLDQFDAFGGLPSRTQQHAHEVQGIEVVGSSHQHGTINLGGFVQLATAMQRHRPSHRFSLAGVRGCWGRGRL